MLRNIDSRARSAASSCSARRTRARRWGIIEDSKLSLSELVHRDLSRWKRCAVVTDLDWSRHAISVFRFMMPGEVECFATSQVQEAIDWAAS